MKPGFMIAAALLAACTSTVQLIAPRDGGPDVAPRLDAPDVSDVDVLRVDIVDVVIPIDVPTGQQRCAGAICASGEACCLTSGRCYDPARAPEQCPRPTVSPDGNPNGSDTWCASDAHCGPGGFCKGSLCLGPGRCEPSTECFSTGMRDYCGCDGRTFHSGEEACRARVRLAQIAGPAPCGMTIVDPIDAGPPGGINCGLESQCPAGFHCCFLLGYCVEETCPECCRVPPPGTTRPCHSDGDCDRGRFCDGEGCDTPGWCRGRATPDRCTGELDPVCGCNGRSYQNEGCAAVAGTRVAHRGVCS